MKVKFLLFVLLTLVLTISACSPFTTIVGSSGGPAAPVEEEYKPPSGYKKKIRDGTQVYCRKETQVGTRFLTEYCFTQNDLERIDKIKRSIQQDHSTRTKMCTSRAVCGER